MIKEIKVQNFIAVPHLETASIMSHHKGSVKFSTEKPNVIVGPNGSGKSSLVAALSLRALCFYTYQSGLDNNLIGGNDGEKYWFREKGWSRDWEFLPGLKCITDSAPALNYRPNYIPGNDFSLTHAMMMGYSNESDEVRKATDKKSSGQQSRAMQDRVMAILAGDMSQMTHRHSNWRYGVEKLNEKNAGWVGDYHFQAEVLKDLVRKTPDAAMPLILMDEPEQSLDLLTENALWQAIGNADCKKMQVIVATHSLYPFLEPEKFHFIEAEKGYVKSVQKALASMSLKKSMEA